MRNTFKKSFTTKLYLEINKLASFNVIYPDCPHFYVQSHSTKRALKTSFWGRESRNPLKGLQFVSLDTREGLRYSNVNFSLFLQYVPKRSKLIILEKKNSA